VDDDVDAEVSATDDDTDSDDEVDDEDVVDEVPVSEAGLDEVLPVTDTDGEADGVGVTDADGDGDAVAAGVPGPAGVTTAVIFRVVGSFTATTSVAVPQAGSCGVLNTQAGKDTSRSRAPKSPPTASANPE
jgi:hypothetical protein